MKFMTKSNQIRAVTVRELTRHVAEIFDYVEGGEPVLLIRHGRPIATIQPLEQFVVRRALEERGLVQTQTAPQVPGEQTEPPPDLTVIRSPKVVSAQHQPTIKGLQALDIRSEANDGGAVS